MGMTEAALTAGIADAEMLKRQAERKMQEAALTTGIADAERRKRQVERKKQRLAEKVVAKFYQITVRDKDEKMVAYFESHGDGLTEQVTKGFIHMGFTVKISEQAKVMTREERAIARGDFDYLLLEQEEDGCDEIESRSGQPAPPTVGHSSC